MLWPGCMALAMFAVLIALGNWQIRRLAWKEALLADIARSEAAPAIALPPEAQPYEKVRVTGRWRDDLAVLYGAEVHDTRSGPVLGGQEIVPLQRPAGPPVLVDRGWVPFGEALPRAPTGETSVDGYVRPPDRPGLFSAKDDPAKRRFYTLDPSAIGAALGLPAVAPFTLVAIGEAPPGGIPEPAKHLPRPPNDHLGYALTWYGLAATLVVVFALWSRKVLRS